MIDWTSTPSPSFPTSLTDQEMKEMPRRMRKLTVSVSGVKSSRKLVT